MTPEVWYQTDRSHFRLVSFSEWHYADEPFLSPRLLQLRSVPPRPDPGPDFDGRIWLRVSFIVSLFLWLRDDWLRYFRFHSSLPPFFYLSTARVRHVPIRMVSSI